MNNEPFKRSVSINTRRPIYDLSRSGSTGSLYNSRFFFSHRHYPMIEKKTNQQPTGQHARAMRKGQEETTTVKMQGR